MQDINKILASLSPEKRALLEKKLKQNSQINNAFPISFSQKRLWFLDQLQPGTLAYNIPIALKIKGNLNKEILKKSILAIVDRHEILRGNIVVLGDSPMLVINQDFKLRINDLNYSELNSNQKQTTLEETLYKNSNHYFQLDKDPLFNVHLFTLSEEEYVLQIVMHHIISDGWSVGIFVKEFSQCYEAFIIDQEPILSPLKIQYADFAKWQENWSKSESFIDQYRYWEDKFKTLPPKLNLPYDKSTPSINSIKADFYSELLDEELSKKIKSFTQKNGVTGFMFFITVLKILVSKIAREDDIAIGTPIANRNKKEIEHLIGFFVNTLVLRTYIDYDIAFGDLLNNVKKNVLEAYDHQDLPFEYLVEKLNPERDMNSTPLFQIMFVYQNIVKAKIKINNLDIEPIEQKSETTKFDLSFNVSENQDIGYRIGVEYNSDLFSKEIISVFINSYKELLNNIMSQPEKKICKLSLIDGADNKNASCINKLSDFNPVDRLEEIFRKKVKLYGDKVALKFGKIEYTYTQLDIASNKLAYLLEKKGVKRNSLVGIHLDRSPNVVVAIIAIMKRGAGYLPLDPVYPDERISFMIEDASVSILITENKFKEKFTNLVDDKILIDTELDDIQNIETDLNNIEKSINDTAYVIYTSGSTGKPKGTIITHLNIARLFLSGDEIYNFSENDVWCLFHSYSFDFSVWEIWGALLYGGKLIIIPQSISREPEEFYNVCSQEGLTVLNQTPSAFEQFIGIDNQLINSKAIQTLRYVIFGGEALNYSTLKPWLTNHKINAPELINMYGITETTVHVTHKRVFESEIIDSFNSNIGKPLSDLAIYIMDDQSQVLPYGIPGEICIAGKGLSSGYLNRNDLTEEKFIKNPYSNNDGSRLYRSGDLGKMMPNGDVIYLGRIDKQIQLRGFRVEIGEIETSLNHIEQISKAIVILHESKNEKILVAYLVSSDQKINTEEIRGKLKTRLPEYMIPSIYIKIDFIPLTANGKVNYKLLPEPEMTREVLAEEYVEPKTEIEKELALLFTKLLNINKVGRNDNFFELGGHSLLATKLVAGIRNKFKINFPLKNIFEKPTLQEIARIIEELLNNVTSTETKIKRAERKENVPLSFAQQRLWFLDQIEPESAFYNIPVAVRLKGVLNLDYLKKSIINVIKRHEILRTTFNSIDGKPIQLVNSDFEFDLKVKDLSKLSNDEKEEKARLICDEELKVSFSLEEIPLFKITCVIINENEFLLVTSIHHIISDGWSSNILMNEISFFYSSYLKGITPQLPELEIQYSDYSIWQRNWLKDNELEKRISFWKKYIESAPTILKLPLDKKRPEVQTYNGNILQLNIGTGFGEAIRRINKENNSTNFMFFLSLFNLLLYRLTNQDDMIVGTPVANREAPEIQNLIGLFVNTIAIRTSISDVKSFSELIKHNKLRSVEAFDNKDLPFEKILDAIKLDRNPSYAPLFQVMFTYNPFERSETEMEGINGEEFEFKSITSKFDLSLTVQEIEDKSFVLAIEYNTDLFESNTIIRWLENYKNLLNEVTFNTHKPILNYSLDANFKNYTPKIIDLTGENFIQRFKSNVKNTPSKIIISQKEKNLSYLEFDKITDSFANELITSGVKQGDFIGIFLERSIEAIVSMFAVMKIGAAFIPIDRKYPIERINYIINDSKLAAIISASNSDKNIQSEKIIYISNYENYLIKNEVSLKYNYSSLLPAYIIYTSGTTGNPKGVLVSNKNLNSFIQAASRDYNITENDKILQFSSLSFDTCIEEIFPIIYQGGAIELRTDEVLESNEYLLSLAKDQKITILDLPTAYWHQLTNEMIDKKLTFHSELRMIITGGEKASKEIFIRWFDNYGKDITFLNTYGPTEGTVVATYWSSKEYKAEYSEELPIGIGLSSCEIFVLDNEYSIVPTGVIGQLFIGGDSTTYGYLNDSVKTAQQFIPNPYSDKVGERLYKTGDLVRRLPSGNIEFIGRADNQIKIRGFRVELSEIENSINDLDFINEVVVINKVETERNRLICFYTSQRNRETEYAEFVASLKIKLPDYMIPSSFVKLDKLPFTVNGKVDIKLLGQRKIEVVNKSRNIVQPTNEKENIIYGIWKELLGKQEFGITDNFFELGGDSILGIQIISKVRQKGLVLKPVHLFQHQTIRELAVVASEGIVLKADQGIVSGKFPMTPIQRIFFNRKFDNENHWNQSLLFKVDEHLDANLIEQTVAKIIEHHDALRSRILIGDEFALEITKDIDVKDHFEYQKIESEKFDYNISIESLCKNAQESLNLKNGPIFKVIYVELPSNESRVFFVTHHIAIDGVSWRILLEDFQIVYSQLKEKKEISLPSKTTSFNEWATRCLEFSNSDKIKNDYSYWNSISNNHIPSVDLEESCDNSEESSLSEIVVLNEEVTQNLLTSVHEKYSTKINDILLTALLKGYSRWTGRRSMTINLEGHGRENVFPDLDVSRTIGWFTTIYPLVLDMKKTVSLSDLIPMIKEQIRNVPSNGFTYGLIKHLSNDVSIKNSLENIENDYITFNYLGQLDNIMNEASIFKMAEENKGFDRDPKNKRESFLDITSSIFNKKLTISFNYSANCFSKGKIISLVQYYEDELKNLVDHCLIVEKKHLSASDFSMAKLDDKKLNNVLSKLKKK